MTVSKRLKAIEDQVESKSAKNPIDLSRLTEEQMRRVLLLLHSQSCTDDETEELISLCYLAVGDEAKPVLVPGDDDPPTTERERPARAGGHG